jgi:predicted ATPase
MSIKRLTLKKLLSFNDSTIELGQLNVLIGPNAVGKSNLIEAVSLLQSAPTSIANQILRGGGIRQWLWLGDRAPSPIATIECELVPRRGPQVAPSILVHSRIVCQLHFSFSAQMVRTSSSIANWGWCRSLSREKLEWH